MCTSRGLDDARRLREPSEAGSVDLVVLCCESCNLGADVCWKRVDAEPWDAVDHERRSVRGSSKILRPSTAPATSAFVAGRLYDWASAQWTEGAGALNALFLFADVFNRRGLQSYSDESDARFAAHLAERREQFETMARTSVPREEVARTLTLKFQSRDKSSMVKIRVFVPFPSPQRDTKLPLIVYYHGGGFVVLSAHAYENHSRRLANAVGAIVASVD